MPTVKINGRSAHVTWPPGMLPSEEVSGKSPWQQILGFKPFEDYCEGMDHGLVVRSIDIPAVTMFGSRIGFMFINADIVRADDGSPVPGAAFLRGGTVIILVILRCEGQEYVVIVRQPRSPVGSIAFAETPAGMLDGSGKFAGKAAQELKEELGLEIREEDLIDMTKLVFSTSVRGIYASAGGSDEFGRFMLYRRDVTSEELASFKSRKTGAVGESERIVTDVIPLQDLWTTSPSSGTFTALYLYGRLDLTGLL